MQYAACLAQHPTWVRQEMSYHLETHMTYKTSLVGGLEHLDYFSTYWEQLIIPTDELHHFSEG
jgi:hypothetical protein